jgi:hypothetical protein
MHTNTGFGRGRGRCDAAAHLHMHVSPQMSKQNLAPKTACLRHGCMPFACWHSRVGSAAKPPGNSQSPGSQLLPRQTPAEMVGLNQRAVLPKKEPHRTQEVGPDDFAITLPTVALLHKNKISSMVHSPDQPGSMRVKYGRY